VVARREDFLATALFAATFLARAFLAEAFVGAAGVTGAAAGASCFTMTMMVCGWVGVGAWGVVVAGAMVVVVGLMMTGGGRMVHTPDSGVGLVGYAARE
jgi:hypothetical protein